MPNFPLDWTAIQNPRATQKADLIQYLFGLLTGSLADVGLALLGSCGSLNVIGPDNLIGSDNLMVVWLSWSGYGLVGGSVSLWGRALRSPRLGTLPRVPVDFLSPVRCRTLGYFSSTMSACTPPCFLP